MVAGVKDMRSLVVLERMVLWKITRSLQRSRSIGSRRKSQRHVTLPDDLLLRSGTGRLVPHRVSQDRQEARHGKSSIWFKTLDIPALDVIGHRRGDSPHARHEIHRVLRVGNQGTEKTSSQESEAVATHEASRQEKLRAVSPSG